MVIKPSTSSWSKRFEPGQKKFMHSNNQNFRSGDLIQIAEVTVSSSRLFPSLHLFSLGKGYGFISDGGGYVFKDIGDQT